MSCDDTAGQIAMQQQNKQKTLSANMSLKEKQIS